MKYFKITTLIGQFVSRDGAVIFREILDFRNNRCIAKWKVCFRNLGIRSRSTARQDQHVPADQYHPLMRMNCGDTSSCSDTSCSDTSCSDSDSGSSMSEDDDDDDDDESYNEGMHLEWLKEINSNSLMHNMRHHNIKGREYVHAGLVHMRECSTRDVEQLEDLNAFVEGHNLCTPGHGYVRRIAHMALKKEALHLTLHLTLHPTPSKRVDQVSRQITHS